MKQYLKFLVVVLGVTLISDAANAQRVVEPVFPAPAQTKDEIGKPILRREVTSGKEFANILRKGCRLEDTYVSCEQILGMFEDAENLARYEIHTMEKLYEYLENTWDVVPCTPGKSATMYRALLNVKTKGKRVAADWNRPCRSIGGKAELWLIDRETGQIIVSLWCGNVIASADEGAVQTKYFDVPKKVVVPVLAPALAASTKLRTYITAFDSVRIGFGSESQVVIRKDTVITAPDSSEFVVKILKSNHAGGTSIKKLVATGIGGFLAGFGASYLVPVSCKAAAFDGGPVNPPNGPKTNLQQSIFSFKF